jgi:methyltransferase (TIGR00027 family)
LRREEFFNGLLAWYDLSMAANAAAAQTAVSVTLIVALEQHFPEPARILDDPLACRFLPLGWRAFVRMMRHPGARDWMVQAAEQIVPGLWSGLGCRKRYIDEKVVEAAGRGLDVVSLGAGFDTRAYRLRALADQSTWEVDQPANIERKRARLQQVLGGIPARRTLVPMDFDRDELAGVLSAHGYAPRPTLFIMEAVSQYLTQAGIEKTFQFLAAAAPGSALAFTYVRRDFLDGNLREAGEFAYRQFVKKKTWHFGMDPEQVAGFLATYGWRVAEHFGYEELAARYVEPTGRKLVPSTIERIVYAEKS